VVEKVTRKTTKEETKTYIRRENQKKKRPKRTRRGNDNSTGGVHLPCGRPEKGESQSFKQKVQKREKKFFSRGART